MLPKTGLLVMQKPVFYFERAVRTSAHAIAESMERLDLLRRNEVAYQRHLEQARHTIESSWEALRKGNSGEDK